MAATPRTGHVFISYRQVEPDKSFAHRLAYDLQAAGHPVWIDVEGLEAGQTWNTEIQAALDACYAYVVILTPEALASRWVRNELLYALGEKAGAIYPVLLNNVKLPPEIISIQYVDFRNDYPHALAELIENLPVPPAEGSSPMASQRMRLPEPPPRRGLPVWAWGAIGAALLAVIVVAGILLSGGSKTAAPPPSPTVSLALTEPPSVTPTDQPTLTPTAGPSDTPSAPLGSPGNPIVFDFVADQATSGLTLQASQTIVDRLSQLTGLTIHSTVDVKLSQVVGSMCTRSVQMGTLTTLSYLWAQQSQCAVPGLVSLRAGGSSYYVSQVIARSGTVDIKALKGKTFCRIDEISPSSWVMPKILMKAEGIDPDKDFAAIKDLGDAKSVVQGVYDNECDGGGTFSDARNDLVSTLPDVLTKVKFLEKTPNIPDDVITFIPEVPESTRTAITNALIQMSAQDDMHSLMLDQEGWTGLQQADDHMYDAFRLFFGSTGYKYQDFVK